MAKNNITDSIPLPGSVMDISAQNISSGRGHFRIARNAKEFKPVNFLNFYS